MIKQAYLKQVVKGGATLVQAEMLWQEIEQAYNEAGRFFHDLSHVEQLYQELKNLPAGDWPALLFAVVYHDVVSDVEQDVVLHNNEERSADFAERHLTRIGFEPEGIAHCRQLILATVDHRVSPDHDTNLFTDADLCILGKPWPVYDAYRKNIRQEYRVYPDPIFSAGRKKILLSFLQMEPLFKTHHFQALYEKTAKENLQRELSLL